MGPSKLQRIAVNDIYALVDVCHANVYSYLVMYKSVILEEFLPFSPTDPTKPLKTRTLSWQEACQFRQPERDYAFILRAIENAILKTLNEKEIHICLRCLYARALWAEEHKGLRDAEKILIKSVALAEENKVGLKTWIFVQQLLAETYFLQKRYLDAYDAVVKVQQYAPNAPRSIALRAMIFEALSSTQSTNVARYFSWQSEREWRKMPGDILAYIRNMHPLSINQL